LNLVVLRVADIERAAGFYRLLGLTFVRHAHGSGPQHYACEGDGLVLELYPATAVQPVTASVRIGFAVEDVDRAVAMLRGAAGAEVILPPTDSEWGRRAIVADPDGHRVELVATGRASPERRVARATRALLERAAVGEPLAENAQLQMILSYLEHALPQMLAEVFPHWKYESLDGFLPAESKKLGEGQAEIRGLAILISDQAVTPFHVKLQIAPTQDTIDWLECHIGKRGNGPGGMERIPYARWKARSYALLQEALQAIDWAYSITVGERREG
jgi:predicted enzyme related to lactoylglutathione lyase